MDQQASRDKRRNLMDIHKTRPTFDGKSTTWRQYKIDLRTYMKAIDITGIPNVTVDEIKTIIAAGMKGSAAMALSTYGIDTTKFTAATTVDAYIKALRNHFSPASETELAFMAFKQRIQGKNETVQHYYAEKVALFKIAEGDHRDGQYFRYLKEGVLTGIYSPAVREHVIRMNTQDEDGLEKAIVAAVATLRECYLHNTGTVQSLDGLAAIATKEQHQQEQAEQEDMDWESISKIGPCYNCGENGHLSRKCPRERKSRPAARTVPRKTPSTEHECGYCSQAGHFRRDCFLYLKHKQEREEKRKKNIAKKEANKQINPPRKEDIKKVDDYSTEEDKSSSESEEEGEEQIKKMADIGLYRSSDSEDDSVKKISDEPLFQ